jgi:hypothetical protein
MTGTRKRKQQATPQRLHTVPAKSPPSTAETILDGLDGKVDQPVAPPESAREKARRKIEKWRRCPICWSGFGGFARATSTQGVMRYYKCCRIHDDDGSVVVGGCGHTWSVKLKLSETVMVQYRDVDFDER